MSERAESESAVEQMSLTETIRSLVDGTGIVLGAGALAVLGYLALGDWMLEAGIIGQAGHTAGAAIAFVIALVLALSAGMIIAERWGGLDA